MPNNVSTIGGSGGGSGASNIETIHISPTGNGAVNGFDPLSPTTLANAFSIVNSPLYSGVNSITDIIIQCNDGVYTSTTVNTLYNNVNGCTVTILGNVSNSESVVFTGNLTTFRSSNGCKLLLSHITLESINENCVHAIESGIITTFNCNIKTVFICAFNAQSNSTIHIFGTIKLLTANINPDSIFRSDSGSNIIHHGETVNFSSLVIDIYDALYVCDSGDQSGTLTFSNAGSVIGTKWKVLNGGRLNINGIPLAGLDPATPGDITGYTNNQYNNPSVNVQTLTANKTLTPSDSLIQLLNGGSAIRTISFDNTAFGDIYSTSLTTVFKIKNTGTNNLTVDLTPGASTITPSTTKEYVYNAITSGWTEI